MASKKLINFGIQSAQASQEEDIAATTQPKLAKKKTARFAKNLTSNFNEVQNDNQ